MHLPCSLFLPSVSMMKKSNLSVFPSQDETSSLGAALLIRCSGLARGNQFTSLDLDVWFSVYNLCQETR